MVCNVTVQMYNDILVYSTVLEELTYWSYGIPALCMRKIKYAHARCKHAQHGPADGTAAASLDSLLSV
jgi:hypothetical protein